MSTLPIIYQHLISSLPLVVTLVKQFYLTSLCLFLHQVSIFYSICELYLDSLSTITPTGQTFLPITYHTSTDISNGVIVVIGGRNNGIMYSDIWTLTMTSASAGILNSNT